MATASVIKTVYKTINAILSANDVSFNDVITHHLAAQDHTIDRLRDETKLWQKDASQRVNAHIPEGSPVPYIPEVVEEPSSDVE